MLLEVINTYGVQIIGTLLMALAGVLGMALRNLAARFLDTETKRTLAKAAVGFVEQTYRDLHGEEKLQKALAVLAQLLQEKHITATHMELTVLLEAAVAEFNGAFHRSA